MITLIITGAVCLIAGYFISEYLDYRHLNERVKSKPKKRWWRLLRGKFRLLFGNCPACNSDAPAMYDCKICDFRTNYNNRKKSEDRKYWWNRFIILIKKNESTTI